LKVHVWPDFDREDLRTLEALAELVVIALENSHQFAELRRVKGLVGTRTAMAFMGLMSAVWRHSIERDATTIRDSALLLRQDLDSKASNDDLREQIDTVLTCAQEILDRRPLPSVSDHEEVRPVSIARALSSWGENWKSRLEARHISFQTDLQIDTDVMVRVSREWLGQALEILVRNAVDALDGQPVRRVLLTCQRRGSLAEILITDTGHGIPEDVRSKLLMEVISKATNSKGFGTGLLLAQAIIETCGGVISLARTGPDGTTMKVTMPIEN
jgi:signal transduction histidine kinase